MLFMKKTGKRILPVLLCLIMVITVLPIGELTAFAGAAKESDFSASTQSSNSTKLATPVISSVSNTATGAKISWKKVNGAERYRVFYKIGNGDWHKAGETSDTSFIWTKAKSGNKYTFTVRCISANGSTYTSDYDHAGVNLDYIAAPKISLDIKENAIQIKWNDVNGAENYRVFYKNSSGGWSKLTDTTSTSCMYNGITLGKKYTFTVRCLSADGKSYISSYDPDGQTVTYVKAPEILSASNAASGAKITWEKVSGAEKYRLFYKTGNSGWTKITDTTSTSYTWKEAESGKKYTFTVCCINEDGRSHASTYDKKGLSLDYIAAPKISLVANETSIKIKWDKVNGAEKYRVFYKNSSGEWSKLTDTASTSYTYKGIVSGQKYTFTVRCLSADGKSYISSYDHNGQTVAGVAAPKISSVTCASTGVQIKWGKVSGAEKYRVFYKTGSGSWKKIADTADTGYIWTGANSGQKYTFTVRCINADGVSYASTYDKTGKSLTYIAAPKISFVRNVASGVEINWGKVEGAPNYRVFYKANGEDSWHKAGDTTSTSFTWTKAKSGTYYTFMVRCTDKKGENYISAYDPAGKSITYIAAPKVYSAANGVSGVQIKWRKVEGAEKYCMFYKIGNGDWVWIGNTTSTSYTWTGAKTGTTYTFTVRCMSSDGSTFTSGYDDVGKSTTYYPSLNLQASVAADTYSNCTRYVYGKSAMGYPLEAYIINGNGKNNRIIFMDFAVHGYEDEYAKDGKVLVTLGNGLVEYYSSHPELLGDYRLVIVPCANPDGTMYGNNNYRADVNGAFGRCTYKGIDINRDFMAGRFKAVESVALRNLMNKYTPNVYLNFHGWEDSVIGNPQLVSIFRSKVGLTTDKSNRYGSDQGFIIAYVNANYNAKAALVEFRNSSSVSQTKVINAINNIISSRL